MAELGALLPATLAHGIYNRLTRLAKTHEDASAEADTTKPRSEPRTRDQYRADLLADLLLHGAPTSHDGLPGHGGPDGLLAGICARVEVTVPVLTLIGDETHGPVAAELNGRHPIDPHTARLLAGGVSVWDRVLTDPITGAVLAVDRYRPSEDLKRFLHARDSRCRFPGCNLPAADLDLDHTRDAAHGGPTTLGNLAGLCRRHHVLKHQTPWSVKQAGPPHGTKPRPGTSAGSGTNAGSGVRDGTGTGTTIAQRMGVKIGTGTGTGTGTGNGTGAGTGFRPPPGPGTLEWTSPTGRTHLDHPPTPATHTRQHWRPDGPGSNRSEPSPAGGAPGNADPPF